MVYLLENLACLKLLLLLFQYKYSVTNKI
jgi:hypothetical protein